MLAKKIDIDETDGWFHLVNTCDPHRDSLVVANNAARHNVSVKHYGKTLDASIDELRTNFVALWVINRQRDSIELLNSPWKQPED